MPGYGGAIMGHLAKVHGCQSDQLGPEQIADAAEDLRVVHEVVDFAEFEMGRTKGKAALSSLEGFGQLRVKQGPVQVNLRRVEDVDVLDKTIAVKGLDLFRAQRCRLLAGAGIKA